MDGLELYKKIKAADEKVKVCFLSSVHNLRDYKQDHPTLVDAIERVDECFYRQACWKRKVAKADK